MSTGVGTKLHSFISIFEEVDKIVIPIIQRDYAQGRRNAFVDRVRAAFLDSLYEAIVTAPTTLDFVYGDIPPKRRGEISFTEAHPTTSKRRRESYTHCFRSGKR